jgi:hypothetical protein
MPENAIEIVGLYPQIIINEMIEKTGYCALVWSRTSPSSYTAGFLLEADLYTIFLSKVGANFVIDVLLTGVGTVFSTSGDVNSDLALLWDAIERSVRINSQLEDLKEFVQIMDGNRCQPLGIGVFNENSTGGAFLNGAAI